MNSTLNFILQKYNLVVNSETAMPMEIPGMRKADIPQLLHELKLRICVEVGVAAGKFSKELCKVSRRMKVHGVDLWEVYEGYTDYSPKEMAAIYAKAKARLTRFRNFHFIRESSMEAVKRFKDESLHFVYLDSNHSEPYITQDITEWSKKLKPGSILAGHDYYQPRGRPGWCNVIEATNRYTEAHGIRPWFVLGARDEEPGPRRDAVRSWLWVKS